MCIEQLAELVSLGNIYKGTFQKPTEPIDCTRDWCTCAADINITKVKNGS